MLKPRHRKILDLHRAGRSVSQIAHETDETYHYVRDVLLSRRLFTPRSHLGRPASTEPMPRVRQMLDMLASGLKGPDVAFRLGVSPDAVRMAAKRWSQRGVSP